MVDFLMISTKSNKKGTIEIYPKFIIKKSKDLMIRGGDFYAIWLEDRGMWSTDEQDALQLIDRELDIYKDKHAASFDGAVRVLHMWDSESGMIDAWHKYCQKHMRDSYVMLDEKLIFSNEETTKKDYASKRLPYPLEPGECPAYDKLIGTLYSPEERMKIEWAIGSIITGDSKKIQKFIVLYGAAGTGKSTILNIIQKLFEGYYSVFDAKALGSSNNSFALESFKANPLVAIQHDGDLSRLEDNTRLNSLVSHELMTVNEKFKSAYANRFKAFLFMGTNKPVRITDGRSGLIRRLIDVSPSGKKLSQKEYAKLVKQVDFELGAIACHCRDVYLEFPERYDSYIPTAMLGASNDFWNFVMDSYYIFKRDDGVTLKSAWEMYKTYCSDANITYPYTQRIFREELKNYFWECKDRHTLDDGTRVRNYYHGFRTDKFEDEKSREEKNPESWIELKEQPSVLDDICKECIAQYANEEGKPANKWSKVKTTLQSLDTRKLHYIMLPLHHIVIDFDIPGPDGEKSLEENLKAASKFPPTYAEVSKSGKALHLHYIYTGDPTKLEREYAKNIEIKVFTGNSSDRRQLTLCNDIPVATISSGLPTKGDKKMLNQESIRSERGLRSMIERNLAKEFHPGTKPSIDFIFKILDDAYNDGLCYDVTDMYNAVLAFATQSSHQAEYCIKKVNEMKFKSEEATKTVSEKDTVLIFYDVEVFPNLFIVNYKAEGEGKKVVRMINPTSAEIEELLRFRLVGFNCRRYDNHILYARLLGYSNEQLFKLSQRIIEGDRNAFFGEAYTLSYTDVLDFSSKKQSLKKFEIELGIHHKELGLPWDQPVPEEKWVEVAEYCDNDVIATEAVFHARKADFTARQILADVAGMTVNDTTNSLTTRIIFGDNRKPQEQFNYRKMGEVDAHKTYSYMDGTDPEWNKFDGTNPIFPGYKFEAGKSIYRGEEVGEGGYVYAEPGIYWNVALLDIASMHPSSIIAEDLFGPEYTRRFREIRDARIAIKHGNFEKAKKMLGGKLEKYLTDESAAKDLAGALKIAINSVYGLTSAGFSNPFKDPRNIDNIVAKRGALFMVNLKHEVQARGFRVAHIKTDSIKIPNATPEIIQFVMDYGKIYGYDFEHEATYDRMCLVNDAVYIAKYQNGDWTATGAQFAVPYVFKKLFSQKEVEFEDLCETKAVTSSLYLDMNENLPDVTEFERLAKARVQLSKDESKVSKKDQALLEQYKNLSSEELISEIDKGHAYHFVGKVGSFCPIKPGFNGGILLREKDGKFYAATGSKGYRWLEAETVKELGKEEGIDISYYDKLVDEAVKTVSKYGDFEEFVRRE